MLGGRGTGKTEAGARYVDDHAKGPPCLEGKVPHRIAIVAPSHDDAVNTCVQGETGLRRINTRIAFHPGDHLRADLTWPYGADAALFGTFAPEDVERFRGPQHCLIWATSSPRGGSSRRARTCSSPASGWGRTRTSS
jgi:phage terminase large subunit-like protein